MLLQLLACQAYESGASEPIRVRDGSFHEGDLPVDDTTTTPSVIYAASVGYVITQGQGNIGYKGLASPDAYSVAVAFPDVGSGYWVVPVDGPDVTQNNNLLFSMTIDFGPDVPYGLTNLQFSALDQDGHPGPVNEITLCVLPDFADGNFAACSPDIPPQHTILSLSWDTDVDLDLVVVTPSGVVVDPGSPSTETEDTPEDEEIGVLTRDSNNGCDIDGIRIESLVFEEEPPPGDYQVYASLNGSCGEWGTNFALDQYTRGGTDGAWTTETTEIATGVVFASQADGGETLGTRVATVTLP